MTMTIKKRIPSVAKGPKLARVTPAPGKGKKPHALKMPATLIGMDIITALRDPNLLGYSIKNPGTYAAWIAATKAAFGLRMNKAEQDLYGQCTRRTDPPTKQFKRILLICGRRSGKSFLQAATTL